MPSLTDCGLRSHRPGTGELGARIDRRCQPCQLRSGGSRTQPRQNGGGATRRRTVDRRHDIIRAKSFRTRIDRKPAFSDRSISNRAKARSALEAAGRLIEAHPTRASSHEQICRNHIGTEAKAYEGNAALGNHAKGELLMDWPAKDASGSCRSRRRMVYTAVFDGRPVAGLGRLARCCGMTAGMLLEASGTSTGAAPTSTRCPASWPRKAADSRDR